MPNFIEIGQVVWISIPDIHAHTHTHIDLYTLDFFNIVQNELFNDFGVKCTS